MSRILKVGSVGSDVYNLERMILALGFAIPDGVDTKFTKRTENVVKHIQKAHGLEVDGLVGPATIAKIKELGGKKVEGFTSSGADGYKAASKSIKNRKLEGVHPTMQNKAEQIIAFAKRDGFEIRVTQGLRTFAEQDRLYAKGRRGRRGERKVTNAKGGQSYHNYGIAVDFAFWVNGRISWKEELYRDNIGRWVKEVGGCTWGGWWNFVDYPHVQLKGVPRTRILLADYKKFGKGRAAIEKIWEKYIK